MSLARWLIFIFSMVLVALILSSGALLYLAWKKSDQERHRYWEGYASTVAWQLRARTLDIQKLVQGLAADPRVIEATLAGDGYPEAEAARLTRIIPDAVMVHIVSPGLDSEQPSLSYADLDLAHRAVSSTLPPAVHGFGSPQTYLAVAHVIKSGDQVTGVLLVGLDLKWLREILPAPPEGAIALMQGKLMLVYRGDQNLREQAAAGSMPVAGTSWQLKYWSPPLDWNGLLGGSAITISMILAMGGLFLFFWRRLQKSLEQDRATLFTLSNDLISGTRRNEYRPQLDELQPLVDRLLMVRPAEAGGLAPASKGPADFMGEGREPSEVPLVSMRANEQQASTPTPAQEEAKPKPEPRPGTPIPAEVFRPCDIRAPADEVLTPDVVRELGRAVGSEIQAQGEQAVVVGRDSRSSSAALAEALIEGLQSSGRDVIELGTIPVPILYFANHYLTHRAGVMVTGSSCPAEYNGLKIMIDGKPYTGDALLNLRERHQRGEISSGMGMLESQDLLADYVGHIIDDVQIGRPIKVIVDSGAGVAGETASALFRTLGCEVDELHSEGMFDPTDPAALHRLMKKVREDDEAELGLAFDGDGDRIAVVDAQGHWIPTDQVLMLLAADALSREPGADIVFDIECSRHVAGYIVQQGGHPVQVAPGYCNLLARMGGDDGAILAGGFGGHLIFKERWFGTVDAIYAAARLIEVLSAEPLTSDEIFAELPHSPATPRLIVPLPAAEMDKVVRLLAVSADKFFDDAKIDTTHGVRVDFAHGWGTVRPSTSLPALVFRFEADDQEKLRQIQQRFQQWFDTIELSISLPLPNTDTDG